MKDTKHVFTLGVEEEFQIIDPETRELRSRSRKILEEGQETLEGQVTSELHQSMVELGTERKKWARVSTFDISRERVGVASKHLTFGGS